MKKNRGITMISLAIMIIILMILATVTMYYGEVTIKEARLQDLKTNMLLIQASLKSDLEKYHFETSTMDEDTKNSKKSEYLKGKELSTPECSEVKQVFDSINTNQQIEKQINEDYPQVAGKFEYYYLDSTILEQIGLTDIKSDKENGYYIVAYSMNSMYPNVVEIINTNGYSGNYSLKRIQAL